MSQSFAGSVRDSFEIDTLLDGILRGASCTWPALGEEHWTWVLVEHLITHSSTLAWKIPWMEKSGRLQSMGLLRVGHN